ncbi:MAG: sulfatase [Gammaproteobacteria bacterium]
MIIVDDLRPEVAAYGDQIALTPNIDRFAETGVLFENVFSSVPVCGASRASMFSGRSPTTNRFIRHDSRLDRELPGVLSLPAYFKDHGYHTVSNGKVFDAQMDSADAWSEPPWNPEGEWHSDRRRNERTVHLQRAWLNDVVGENGPPYERLDVTDSAYPDGQIADKAVNDLRRLRDAESPFLLVVGFRKPHLPFTAPEEYWSMYSPEDFSLPTTYYTIPDGVPSQPIHNSFELRGYAGIPPSGLLEESQALNLIHAYHAAVSYADALVGKVLDGVSDLGLEEDTIVLLLGDHGWSLGEHTQWNKNSLFDIALRTPLIVRVPGRASSRVNAIVSLLDLFPSLTELTGLPTPGDLDGVSLVPALDDPDAAVRTAVLSRWYDGASVRSDRFRYSDWRDESGAIKARMLFDLEADPEETRNVAEESEYKSTVAELSKLITDDRSGLSWSPIVRNFVGNRDGAP